MDEVGFFKRSRQRLIGLAVVAAVAVASLSVLASTVTGATGSEAATAGTAVARKDTLVIGQFRPPTGKIGNPYIQASDALVSDGIHELVLEPLFFLNYENGKHEPWLATGFRYSKGFKTVTVNLRKGVTWADGVAFTSKDVVWTMRQIIDTKPTPFRAGNIQASVKSVRARGAYTVIFELKAPNPRFVYTDLSFYIYTANFIPLPEHVFKGKAFKTFTFYDLKKRWPLGTGPYRLTAVGPKSTTLTRNANWWAAKTGFKSLPAPQQVIYTDPGPEDSAISGLVSGRLDYAGQSVPSVRGFISARKRNPKLINWNGDLGWLDPCPFSLTLNTAKAPWNDRQMRWALNYAINKSQFSSIFNAPGKATPAQTTFPDYPPFTQLLGKNKDLLQKYPTLKYSRSETASILRRKGYEQKGGKWVGPNGQPLTVTVSIFSPSILGPVWGTAAQLLEQQLEAAGFTADMQPGDFNVLIDARTTGALKFDAQTWFECGSVFDPWSTFNRYTTAPGNDNPAQWANASYNRLVAQIGQLQPSDPKIAGLARQALTIWLRDLPVIPLIQRPTPIVMSRVYWKGWPTVQNNYHQPAPWAMSFHQVITRLRPAGGK